MNGKCSTTFYSRLRRFSKKRLKLSKRRQESTITQNNARTRAHDNAHTHAHG